MTLTELREFIQEMGLNDNAKIVVLVAQELGDPDEWHVVKCDSDGKLITV